MKNTMVIALMMFFICCAQLSAASPIGAAENGMAMGESQISSENTQAAPYISQEKALQILRTAFPEILAGKELEAEFNQEGNGNGPYWDFNLKGQADGRMNYGSEISASVDATNGEILSMNYNPAPDYYRGKPVVLTLEQAYPIAQKFLQKIQPDKLSELLLQNNIGQFNYPYNNLPMYYSFNWQRQVNGIKVNWDNVYIGIDASTGKVTHYTYMWHNGEFPKVEKKISASDLTAKLVDEIGLYPTYMLNPSNAESGALTPVYRLNTDCQYFDCQTGQALKQDGTNLADEDKRIFEKYSAPQITASLIETPPQSRQKISPELAKKSAEEYFEKLGITGEIRRSGSGSSSGSGYYDEYWSYSLVQDYISHRIDNSPEININAYTGEFKSYQNMTDQESGGTTVISYTEALSKAQEAIQKLNPEKQNQLLLQKILKFEERNDTYEFYFARLLNGISCPEGIRIEIDKQDGSLISYWLEWHQIKLASSGSLISLEKAQEIFRNSQPFELAYVFPTNPNVIYGFGVIGDPILVYCNAERNLLDAQRGKMLDWGSAKKTAFEKAAFKEHWAAPALSLLEANGLLPEGMKPDDALSRRQALKILIAATRQNYYNSDQEISLAFTDIKADDPDRAILQEAINKGIISNQGSFNPSQFISREEMAVWLVKCLAYQDIAQMKYTINVPFKDLSQIANDKLNYVALAGGLNLLYADENQNFRPRDMVSWAEMAAIATKIGAINRIQNSV